MARYKPEEGGSSEDKERKIEWVVGRMGWAARVGERARERPADLFKSLAVGLTRVDSRKHTRFSLFRRGRLSSLGGGNSGGIVSR